MIRVHSPRFRPLLRAGLTILGPALLLYFIAAADRRLLLNTVRGANLGFVLAAVLLAVPFFALKALRWQLVLRMWDIRLPYRLAVALVCIGQYIGTVTPGQAGDAVRAWYLRERGYPLGVGLASVALDRGCDLVITLAVAAFSLALYRGILPQQGLSLVAGSLSLLLVGLALLLALGNQWLRAAIQRRLPARLPRVLRTRIDALVDTSVYLTPRHLMLILLASVAALSWTYGRIYLLFLALGIPIQLGPLLTFVALLALVGPVTPGGVGTRDALLVVVLQTTLAVEQEQAIAQALAISMLILLLNLVNVALGYVYTLRYQLGRPNAELRDPTQELAGKTTG